MSPAMWTCSRLLSHVCQRNSVPSNVEAVFLKKLQKSVDSSMWTFCYSVKLKKLTVSMCARKEAILEHVSFNCWNNEVMTTT